MMAESMMYTIVGICACIIALCHADLASEAAANSVELKFYRLQSGTWNSGSLETTLAGLIASEANTYCANNLDACQMYACCSAAFKEIDIGKVANYPVDVKKDMTYKLYLKIPAGTDIRNDSTLSYVISESAVRAIIGNIIAEVKKDIGYYITKVGSDFYGLPVADLENKIIIPIACVVLLVLIIIAVVLHFWNKKRIEAERLERKVMRKKEKQQKGKDKPTYDVDTDEPKVPASPDKKTRRRQKRTEEKIYNAKSSKVMAKETPPKHHGGASDTDSAIKMEDRDGYGDVEVNKHQSLPPMKPEVAGDETRGREKKKKKKDKKRKKSKRREEENSAYLGGASDEDNANTTEL